MIIKTPRSRAYALIDFLLTLLAWLAFSYLFAAGLVAVLTGGPRGLTASLVERVLPAAHTLMVYVVVGLCIAALLYAWAQYNTIKFGQRHRRRMYPILTPEALADSVGMTVLQIGILRTSQRVVIHHTDDGLVDVIDVDQAVITASIIRMVG